RLDAGGLDVLGAHPEVQDDSAERVGEAAEDASRPARRRRVIGAQENGCAPSREPADSLDAALAERQRADGAVDRDPQGVLFDASAARVVGPSMQAKTGDGCEHEPGTEVLNESACTQDG